MRNFFVGLVFIGASLFLLPNKTWAQGSPIQLPVEVLGANLSTDFREFSLTNASEVKFLYLLVNNFNAEGKVEVRFNSDANWTSLTSATTWSDTQGNAFGGIGGGYSTLKRFMDLTNKPNISPLLKGTNTVYFRFNNINDNRSVGYRIVELNFLQTSGAAILTASDFEYDDPGTWAPVYSDQPSIDAGEALWHNKTLTDSPKNPVTINAKCASCHAVDGQDLKYFNYSNKSIIERSKFHGLSQLESEQVASYIRSLSTPVLEAARPWNPPYQPGPGLDSKPASEWSAGAGLNWVLDDDADMIDHIFPSGTSDGALDNVFDIKGTLNIREIPVALQFPDWNRWLPEVHPLDMMSPAAYQTLLTGVGLWDRTAGTYGYQKVKENLVNNGVASYNDGVGKDLQTILFELGAGVQDFLFKDWTDSSGTFWWTITESPGISERPAGMLVESFKRDLAKWNAVKHWEIMHDFGIESIKPVNVPYAEERQWPVSNWTVFAIAPHIVGDNRGQSRFIGQDQEIGYYESTAWYQLQMTLNSGMRDPQGVAPVDWSYNFDHITKSGIYTGHKEPLRFIQNLIKAYQQRDNTVLNDGNNLVNRSAWNMREVSPWRLYSTASGDASIHSALDDYESDLRAKLLSKLLKMFMDKADLLDMNDWPRNNNGAWHTIETSSYIPSNYSISGCLFPNANGKCTDIQNAVEADAIFTSIPLFQNIGMDCQEVERLRSWSESMWPLGNWAQFEDTGCTLGVEDNRIANQFVVYPNPTNGLLKLSSAENWTLFDTTGKEIMSGNSKEIDFSSLSVSMYFLKTPYGMNKIIRN